MLYNSPLLIPDIRDYTGLVRVAFNLGVGAIFGLACLYILYLVAISGQKANSDDLQTIKSGQNSVIQQHVTLGEKLDEMIHYQKISCAETAIIAHDPQGIKACSN